METRKNLLLVLGEWWEACRVPVSDTSATLTEVRENPGLTPPG